MNTETKFEPHIYIRNISTMLYNLELVEKNQSGENTEQHIIDDEKRSIELIINDIKYILPHAESELKNFYRDYPNLRKDGCKFISDKIIDIKKILTDEKISFKEQRLSELAKIEDMVETIFAQTIADITPTQKLKINAPAIVVYDLMRQLKRLPPIQGNTPILSQTNEQIAKFMTMYFEGFENKKIETIVKEISREQIIKKSRLEIKVLN
jgi:hypothetical protein